MQKTCVWSLDREDPLEKGMATHSNILAWRIPWTEEPGGQSPCRPSTICKKQHVTKEFSMLLLVKLGFWTTYLILSLDWVNSILLASKGIAYLLSVTSLLLVVICGFSTPEFSLQKAYLFGRKDGRKDGLGPTSLAIATPGASASWETGPPHPRIAKSNAKSNGHQYLHNREWRVRGVARDWGTGRDLSATCCPRPSGQ